MFNHSSAIIFLNSILSAINVKIIISNLANVLNICSVQTKELCLIQINEFNKTSEMLKFKEYWKTENIL